MTHIDFYNCRINLLGVENERGEVSSQTIFSGGHVETMKYFRETENIDRRTTSGRFGLFMCVRDCILVAMELSKISEREN